MIKTREVVAHCPSIGRSSALAAFKRLTEEGLIIREDPEEVHFTFVLTANIFRPNKC